MVSDNGGINWLDKNSMTYNPDEIIVGKVIKKVMKWKETFCWFVSS